MTTYYNSEYQEVSEYYLYEMYDDMLDGVSETIQVFGLTYDPSHVLKELDPVAYRTGFHDYIDSMMQDGDLYEDEHEFIDSLLDDWLHGDGWTDSWEEVEPTELLYAVQHMHSTGRLELVNGEIQPHPDHTISDIQALITEELA